MKPNRFFGFIYSRTISIAFVLTTITFAVAIMSVNARKSQDHPPINKFPASDADKIADTLRVGPTFITKNATILDWPASPGGEYRVLRKGTSEWSCLPAFPGYAHDEPGCFDSAFMNWVKQSLDGQEPHIQSHRDHQGW